MSLENVEVVRRSFDAFARGDFEAAFAAHDPETEWRTAEDEPDSRTYRGLRGLRRLAGDIADPWKDRFERSVEAEEFIDCGDWIVVPWSGRLHGRGSGVEIEVSETYAVHLRGGKIVRVEEYRTKEQALEAVRARE